jgi:hypothetical protein
MVAKTEHGNRAEDRTRADEINCLGEMRPTGIVYHWLPETWDSGPAVDPLTVPLPGVTVATSVSAITSVRPTPRPQDGLHVPGVLI